MGSACDSKRVIWPCMANCRACPFPAGQVALLRRCCSIPLMAEQSPASRSRRCDFKGAQRSPGNRSGTKLTRAGRFGWNLPKWQSVFGPQHVALIVGYESDANDNLFLIVNDPFPFSYLPREEFLTIHTGWRHQCDAGRYRIEYARFRAYLKWTESIYRFRH